MNPLTLLTRTPTVPLASPTKALYNFTLRDCTMYDPDRYSSVHDLVNPDGTVPADVFLPSFQSLLNFELNWGPEAARQTADMETITARQPSDNPSASDFPQSSLDSQAGFTPTTATLAPTDTTFKPGNDQGRQGDVEDSTVSPSPNTSQMSPRSTARDAFNSLAVTHLQFRNDVKNALDLYHKAGDKLSKLPTISLEQWNPVWDVYCSGTELSASASRVTEAYDTYAASRARVSQWQYEEGLGDEDLTAWDDLHLGKQEFSQFVRSYEEMRTRVYEDIEKLRQAAVNFERVMGAGDIDDIVSSDPTVGGHRPDASRQERCESDETEIPNSQLDSRIDADRSEPLLSEMASEAGETTGAPTASS